MIAKPLTNTVGASVPFSVQWRGTAALLSSPSTLEMEAPGKYEERFGVLPSTLHTKADVLVLVGKTPSSTTTRTRTTPKPKTTSSSGVIVTG